MSTVLQWLALATCLAGTLWRLPSMIRGRNGGLFAAFALASVSVALSIPVIYVPVDNFLGASNVANVVLRLCLFGVFFLLASRVAAAYDSRRSLKLLRGPVGIFALSFSVLGLLVSFSLGQYRGSSTGLHGFAPSLSLSFYAGFAQFYLAYVAACLIPATIGSAFSARSTLQKSAGLSMGIGFALVCCTVPIQLFLRGGDGIRSALSFASILFVALGLMLVWVAFLVRRVD